MFRTPFQKSVPLVLSACLQWKRSCVYKVHRARAIWTIDPGWTNWKLSLMIWHLTVEENHSPAWWTAIFVIWKLLAGIFYHVDWEYLGQEEKKANALTTQKSHQKACPGGIWTSFMANQMPILSSCKFPSVLELVWVSFPWLINKIVLKLKEGRRW